VILIGSVSVTTVLVLTTACGGGSDAAGRDSITVSDAVVGASGATEAAAYMVLGNSGAADALVGVDVIGDGSVSMHSTTTSGGRSSMHAVDEMSIPADGRLRLDPGGSHLMVEDLASPLREGDHLTVVLRFEHAPARKVTLEAVPLQSLPDRIRGGGG